MGNSILEQEWVKCGCPECQNMCYTPCIPTPTEAKAIIDAGFGDKLESSWAFWASDDGVSEWELLKPTYQNGQCAFQGEDGLCALHDNGLKPIEGKLALCQGRTPQGLNQAVKDTWNTFQGKRLVEQWYG